MSLVDLDDYKTAIGVSGTDEDGKLSQYSLEIDARVKAFLGYDIEETEYTEETYDGNGTQYLFPKAIPVTSITKLEIYDGLDSDGEEVWDEWVQNTDYSRLILMNGGMIIFIDGNEFEDGQQNFRLTYTAGYTSDTLPQDIQAVCKELMVLKYKGLDKGNLGQPSLSLGMGSNVSVNYDLDEDKILKKIEHYRLIRI